MLLVWMSDGVSWATIVGGLLTLLILVQVRYHY